MDVHDIEIRPRFKLVSAYRKEEILERIALELETDERVQSQIVNHHIFVKVPTAEQHFWSPELSVELHNIKDGGAMVRGIVGPSPKIWTMFMFIYFAIGGIFLFGCIYGLSIWSLRDDASWLWTFPVAIILFIITFMAAKAGQKMGKEQTEQLKLPLRKALAGRELTEL